MVWSQVMSHLHLRWQRVEDLEEHARFHFVTLVVDDGQGSLMVNNDYD